MRNGYDNIGMGAKGSIHLIDKNKQKFIILSGEVGYKNRIRM